MVSNHEGQPDHDRLEAILNEALDIAEETERAKFVQQACGDDAALKAAVHQLIDNYVEAGSFLESVDKPDGSRDHPESLSGSRVGAYRLLEKIGQGGMGVVFLAEQSAPFHRRVAVKILRSGLDSTQVVARFEQERQALALMNHPNVASVIDGGLTADGRPYFAMELIHGQPITQYCDEHQLTPRERLQLFMPVCEAVQHAHQKGIIHRDLKPSNVLVTETDSQPCAKVIDFGVAKAIGHRLSSVTIDTQLGAIIGTLEYMSPEQAVPDGEDIDTRSDIFCLGVLLFELLTGTTPLQRQKFQHASVYQLLRLICEDETPKPSQRLTTVNDLASTAANRGLDSKTLKHIIKGDLDWIVMKCLEKDRNRRYASANALARDIERYLADEPIEAGPPDAGYRTRKFLWRHRRSMAAICLLTLVLVGGIIGTSIGMIQAARGQAAARDALHISEQQRGRAERHYQRAMSAVDRLLTHVGEVRLESVPLMDQTRLRILEDALDLYRDMLQDESDDPAARRELGLAWRRVGDLQSRLGNPQAEASFRRAVEIHQALWQEQPDDDNANVDYLRSERFLGVELYRAGRYAEAADVAQRALSRHAFTTDDAVSEQVWLLYLQGVIFVGTRKSDEAIAAFKQAVESADKLLRSAPSRNDVHLNRANVLNRLGFEYRIRRMLEEAERCFIDCEATIDLVLKQEPDNVSARVRRASVCSNHALLLANQQRSAEAMALYDEAISIMLKLIDEHPGLPDYKLQLAMAYNNLCLLHSSNGEPERAAVENEKAISIFQELVASYPKRLDFKEKYFSGSGNQGKYLAEIGRTEESIVWNTRAIDGCENLLASMPDHTDARLSLHNNLMGRASANRKLGKMDLAIQDYRRCLELSQGETHANYVNFRPRALAFVGQHEQAATAAEAIVSDPKATPFNFSEMAKVYATCAEVVAQDATLSDQQQRELSEKYAVRCVRLLAEAGEKGRFPTLEHISELQTDDRLTLVKERDDFKDLVRALESRLTRP